MTLPQIKFTVGGAACTVAFGHFWGIWSGHVAAIASTAALVWILIQGFFYLKDRWLGK